MEAKPRRIASPRARRAVRAGATGYRRLLIVLALVAAPGPLWPTEGPADDAARCGDLRSQTDGLQGGDRAGSAEDRCAAHARLLAELLAAEDSDGQVRISGLSDTGFNPLGTTVIFDVRGADFGRDPRKLSLLVNDEALEPVLLHLAARSLSAELHLRDGLNELQLLALDSSGRLLRADMLVWAGGNTLVVDVVDEDYEPIDEALVELRLAEDGTVRSETRSRSGTARFEHLPAGNLILMVSASGRSARQVVAAGQGTALVVLAGD